MRIEAVTTCVGYSDFLAQTIVWNKVLFDHWVVVTTPDDEATQKLCEFHHVHAVITGRFGIENGGFCKGAGINEGLQALQLDGWVVHLDADVALPPLTRTLLERMSLDPTMLYGCDRFVLDAKQWFRHVDHPKLQQEADIYVHPDGYRLGTRIASPDYGGYVPLGFFQLWNPQWSRVPRYPEAHTDAGRTDMLFAGLWPRRQRGMLPEIIAYHLDSEPDADQGANWRGRVTKPFVQPRGLLGVLRRLSPLGWLRRRRRRRPPPYPRPAAG